MAKFIANVPIITETPTIEVEGPQPGQRRFQLEAEDESGNRSLPATILVTVKLPTLGISALIPSFGEWEKKVVIRGVNFDLEPQKNIVAFNGIDATVLGATDTELTVSVPKPATTGFVTVKNTFGDASSPVPFIIPRSFVVNMELPPVDLSYDAIKGEVWVVGSTEENKGIVSIVGLEQRKLLFVINLDGSPGEIALSPATERRLALVTHPKDGAISVINIDERKLLEILTIEAIPRSVAISPDGRWGYVVSSGDTSESRGIVSVVDLSEIKVVGATRIGLLPTRVIFGRSGLEAFVNNTGDGTLSVINADSHKVSDTIEVGKSAASSPQEVAVSGETYPVWTANSGDVTASMIAKDHSVINIKTDINPGSVAVFLKGNQAFFAGPKDKTLVMVDMRDGQSTTKIVKMSGIGAVVKGVATTPDDRGVIIVHPDLNAIGIFDGKVMRLQALVKVPALPVRCLVTGDNMFALSICQRGKALSVIEMRSVLP